MNGQGGQRKAARLVGGAGAALLAVAAAYVAFAPRDGGRGGPEPTATSLVAVPTTDPAATGSSSVQEQAAA
uniref:hypothetical protein n=1 Tax=Oceaniglobus roseus TaxID=1737570 RepID=UPI001C12BAD4